MDTPLWMPSASINSLRARAQLLIDVRNFFNSRGYLEVETPVMGHYGITDVYLSNIKAIFRNQHYYLQTSPEYHMKRLLAAGSGPIFQLARVFRDDELGRWHNPEFTLLEWYQLEVDHHQLLLEVDQLLQQVLCCEPLFKMTYREVFLNYCELDPFNTDIQELQKILQRFDLANVLPDNESDIDQYLFLLMSHVVEPALAHKCMPIAVVDFPSSQASLAKIQHGVAERFEIYYRGVELANGFHELTDEQSQAARFEHDLAMRKAKGGEYMAPDKFLLQALKHGLPTCSGVALGFERLMALMLQQTSIKNTLAFDFSRA